MWACSIFVGNRHACSLRCSSNNECFKVKISKNSTYIFDFLFSCVILYNTVTKKIFQIVEIYVNYLGWSQLRCLVGTPSLLGNATFAARLCILRRIIMKKILTLGIVALVLIALSSCQFNIFAAFDRIEIPTVAELTNKATTDPDGFVSDVEDYVENDFLENEDVTAAQEQSIIDNLRDIYDGTITATVDTQQQAAVLVGELEINRDPATSAVVDGIIGAVSAALSAGGSIDPNTLIGEIFPPTLDINGLQNILTDLDNAAAAYATLAPTLAGNDPGMTSGEIGDMAQLAVVALVIASIRDDINNDGTILLAIQNGTPLAVTDNPFDPGSTATFASEIGEILTFAGLNIGL
jgi:hypothetical protein